MGDRGNYYKNGKLIKNSLFNKKVPVPCIPSACNSIPPDGALPSGTLPACPSFSRSLIPCRTFLVL